MSFDRRVIENIPFRLARWYTRTQGRSIRVIVVHSMEAPEKGTTAEAVARYFQQLPASRKASAHYCIDHDSIVQCVQTRDVAYAAPGCNHDGIHLELAGYARQTRAEWLDPSSTATLKNAAWLCGQILLPKFPNIQVRWLNVSDLIAGHAGFTSHYNVSLAYRRSSHWDPGQGFPADQFLQWVKQGQAGTLT